MAKVTSDTTFVTVNQSTRPKNTLGYNVDEGKGTVQIVNATTDRVILDYTHFGEYKNSSNVPYTSLANLITALNTALFA